MELSVNDKGQWLKIKHTHTHTQHLNVQPSNETFGWIHFIQPQSRAHLTECHAQQNYTQARRCDSPLLNAQQPTK